MAKGDSSAETATEEKAIEGDTTEKKKRGLVHLADGSLFDDSLLVQQGLDNDFFAGLASFGISLPRHEHKDDEREPAEGEVRQVMDICNGCSPEPFEKALIFGWRSVPKKIYSGALFIPAAPVCKAF